MVRTSVRVKVTVVVLAKYCSSLNPVPVFVFTFLLLWFCFLGFGCHGLTFDLLSIAGRFVVLARLVTVAMVGQTAVAFGFTGHGWSVTMC